MQDLQPAPTSLKRADLIATIKGLIAEREAFVAGTDADHKINGRIVRYAPRTP